MSCFTQDDKLALNVIKKAFDLDIIVFLDWETFYKSKANNGSKSFSLKSLTYPEYIFDPRFHETGLGLVIDLDEHIEYGHGGNFYNTQIQKLKDPQ